MSQSFSVSCSTIGSLPLEWVWLRNAVEVVPSARVSFGREGPSSTLTLSSLEEGDGGVYQCVVRQPGTGRQDSHSKLIDVRGENPRKVS